MSRSYGRAHASAGLAPAAEAAGLLAAALVRGGVRAMRGGMYVAHRAWDAVVWDDDRGWHDRDACGHGCHDVHHHYEYECVPPCSGPPCGRCSCC